MLANQDQRVRKYIKSHRNTATCNSHHEFMFFKLIAAVVKDGHDISRFYPIRWSIFPDEIAGHVVANMAVSLKDGHTALLFANHSIREKALTLKRQPACHGCLRRSREVLFSKRRFCEILYMSRGSKV